MKSTFNMQEFTMMKLLSGRTLYIKEWWTKEEVSKFQKLVVTKLFFVINKGKIVFADEEAKEEININEIAFFRRLSY